MRCQIVKKDHTQDTSSQLQGFGSSDATGDIARRYPVRLIEVPNGGLSAGPFSGLYVDVYRPGFTCTYDIPWDWAHRCPPIPTPPEPPLAPAARAPSCVPQNVTVPGSDGKDQTITMVRC